MPLYRRVARRGFNNARFAKKFDIVNIGEIADRYADGDTVNADTLIEKRLLKKRHGPVKILGTGDIAVKLSFDVDAISAAAKLKIEKAGGSMVEGEKVSPDGE